MSTRALSLFFELLENAQRSYFPDLFFRGHRCGRPLVVNLPDVACKHVRFRLKDECLHLERVELLGGESGAQDLCTHAQITASSVFAGTETLIAQRQLFSQSPHTVGVHTMAQPGEWVCINLPDVQTVSTVRVHNRDDEWAWRAWSMVVETSLDGLHWTEAYSHTSRLHDMAGFVESAARHANGTPDELLVLRRCGRILAALVAGDHAAAQALLDRADMTASRAGIRQGFNLHLLVHYRRWWSGHGITRTFRYWSASEKRTYIERALELLSDVRALSPEVCFGFGFVLAFVRDGEMIPHDDDLDLIVAFDRAATPTLTQGLALVENHLRARGYTVRGDHFNHRWVFKPGWNAIDVFVGLREPDGVSWFPSARRNLNATDVFPPIDVDLCGQACPIPRNPIRYLESTYGPRWREPDVDFKHPWDRAQFADIA
jgi:hypothetical protein